MFKVPSLASTFVIPAAGVSAAIAARSCSNVLEYLYQVVLEKKVLSRPPISQFQVGAAVIGKSGSVYFGVNLEFAGCGLECSCHGEEFAVTLAKNYGEGGITDLVVNAAPCGYCRQMLCELTNADKISVHILGQPQVLKLTELLPFHFGPPDLGLDRNLMDSHPPMSLALTSQLEDGDDEEVVQAAVRAACCSYCPYSNIASGCAIRVKDGSICAGTYAENSAFNPSMPPWKAALINLVEHGHEFGDITTVVIARTQGLVDHLGGTNTMIKGIAPTAKVSAYYVTKQQ